MSAKEKEEKEEKEIKNWPETEEEVNRGYSIAAYQAYIVVGLLVGLIRLSANHLLETNASTMLCNWNLQIVTSLLGGRHQAVRPTPKDNGAARFVISHCNFSVFGVSLTLHAVLMNFGLMRGLFDIEMNADQAATRPSLGFAALSSWIVSDRDQELLVFRKFGEISARNLLYLQSELLSIEAREKAWDKKVQGSNDTTLEEVAETWKMTIEQANAGKPEAKELLELVNQLRAKIKEYHEALELQSKISQLSSPDERALRVARNELHGGPLRRDGTKPNPILGGRGKDYLDEAEDLVSLKTPAAADLLSELLRDYWPGREELSRDGRRRISRFDERSITITVALVNILLALVLLVGSISSLYYVKSAPAILGTICGFTILFALSVGLITNAKRAEIFAGSAAYAAVLVVFVGNGDQSGCKCS